MLPPGHIAITYFLLNSQKKIKNNYFFVFAFIGSLFPDIDVLFFSQIVDHHRSFLHYPLVWLGLFCVFGVLGLLSKNKIIKFSILGFIIGITSHLVVDTLSAYSAGIYWLAPFSFREYNLLPLHPKYPGNTIWSYYFQSPIFIFEVLIALIAGVIFLIKFKRWTSLKK